MNDGNYIPTAQYCYLIGEQYICVNNKHIGCMLYDLKCIEKGTWDIFYHIASMISHFNDFCSAYPEITGDIMPPQPGKNETINDIAQRLKELINNESMENNKHIRVMPREVAEEVLSIAWGYDWHCLEELDKLVQDMNPTE